MRLKRFALVMLAVLFLVSLIGGAMTVDSAWAGGRAKRTISPKEKESQTKTRKSRKPGRARLANEVQATLAQADPAILEAIRRAANQHGVKYADLAALVFAESRFRPNVKNGLVQICGKKQIPQAQRRDPEFAADWAARHLLERGYGHSPRGALVDYNGTSRKHDYASYVLRVSEIIEALPEAAEPSGFEFEAMTSE